MPGPTLHELLVKELKIVRRSGLHRLGEHLDELPSLRELARKTMGATTPGDVENMLRTIYTQRSEGAQCTAIGILLGLAQRRRGASPRVLRQVAADRLGYQTVDTFRKKPEASAFDTFAHVIESYAIDTHNRPEPEGHRIECIIRIIEELTITEYGELVRRPRQRITTISD